MEKGSEVETGARRAAWRRIGERLGPSGDPAHQRLKDAVVKAAKEWADGRIVNVMDDGLPLIDAVDELLEFETKNELMTLERK